MSLRRMFKNLKFLSEVDLLNALESEIEEKYIEMISKNYPHIKNIEETINDIIVNNASLCRFGDGELQIINGYDIPFQKASKKLSLRLQEVLTSSHENIYIAIPKFIYESKENLLDIPKNFWRANGKNFRDTVARYINVQKQYYAAETTIAFNAYKNFDVANHFTLIKKIWQDKDITIICGKSVFDKIDYNVFKNARSIDYQYAPNLNAFDDYEAIIEKAKKIDKNRMVIIVLGPTAKILAYDMATLGYQALDLGHIAKAYDWWKKDKNTNKMTDALEFFNPD